MGLFRRERASEPQPTTAAEIMAIAVIALGQAGVEPEIDESLGEDFTVVHTTIGTMNLANIISAAHSLSFEDRIALTHAHLQAFLSTATTATAPLSGDELVSAVRTRLMTDEMASGAPQRWRFADGISIVLMFDNPHTVSLASAEQLAGHNLDDLYRHGQRNVDAEPIAQRLQLAPGVRLFGGDSHFIATKVLNLAAFLAHEGIVAPHGVIYGIPHRHLLLLHVVGEGDSVRALTELAGAAMAMSQDAPGGPLSESAYYWHEGASERISVPADGTLHIYPSERLVEALNVTTGS